MTHPKRQYSEQIRPPVCLQACTQSVGKTRKRAVNGDQHGSCTGLIEQLKLVTVKYSTEPNRDTTATDLLSDAVV